MDNLLDFEEFGAMAESEEDEYDPLPQQINSIKILTQNLEATTLEGKREDFRIQIRRQKTDQLLYQKRAIYLPRPKSLRNIIVLPVQIMLKQLEDSITTLNKESLSKSLGMIASISDDEHKINSLFLIKNHFITHASKLMEYQNPLYYQQIFVILCNMTKVHDFFELDHLIILKFINKGFEILESLNDDSLINHILIYFSHVIQEMPQIRDLLLEKQILQLLVQKSIPEQLSKSVINFLGVFSQKYPISQIDKMGLLFIIINKCLNTENQTEILIALSTILKQASPQSISMLAQTQIIQFLLLDITKEQNFEEFYSALNSLKMISICNDINLLTILIQSNIMVVVDSYVYHKFQKLRTVTLYIVMSLCHSNHEILKHVLTDSVVQKLIYVLVADRSNHKSLVLQTIINILTFGSDQDFVKLLDLGVIKQLSVILESEETQIKLQGIKCCEILMTFGQSQMTQNNLSENPILQRMLSFNLIKVVESLQSDENEEVYLKANEFIQTFFEYEF